MANLILIPLDGSELAEGVIASITPLAQRRGAELLLLRVVDADPAAKGSLATLAVDLRAEAERYLRETSNRFASAGLRIRARVRFGSAAEGILETAREVEPFLLAMTARGRTGQSRWSFGHVARDVLRAATVPLLIHPGGDVRTGPLEKGEFLVPVDCSAESLDILAPVADLAQAAGSSLRLLSVCTQPEGCACVDTTPASKQLAAAADGARSLHVSATTTLLEGDPVPTILADSRRPGTSLVAMATHGWRNRSVFRSVTEKVLSAVRIPMLIVRSRRED